MKLCHSTAEVLVDCVRVQVAWRQSGTTVRVDKEHTWKASAGAAVKTCCRDHFVRVLGEMVMMGSEAVVSRENSKR